MAAPLASAANAEFTREVAKPPDMAQLDAFDAWSKRWEQADEVGRAALAQEGADLAAARRQQFKALIATNPRLALERSVPRVIRQNLPGNIVEQLEKPVSAKGEYRVVQVCDHTAEEHQAFHQSHVIRSFVVGEMTYKANVDLALAGLMSRKTAPLQGVAIDDEMAVAANAVRRLGVGEHIPAGTVVEQLDPASLEAIGDVSEGEVVIAEKPMIEIAGRIFSLGTPSQVAVLEEDFEAWVLNEYSGSNSAGFFNDNFPNPAAKKIGNYRILYIRVNYPDRIATPQTEEAAEAQMRETERIFSEWSYGKLVCTTTITPLVTIPWSIAYNTFLDNNFNASSYAQAAVRKLGYDPDQYDTVVVYGEGFGGVSGGNTAIVGGSSNTVLHEVGHQLGAWHAGFWPAEDGTGYGFANTNDVYGNFFDIMGTYLIGGDKAHYSSMNKMMLGWLTSGDVHRAETNGVYRIHAFDQPRLEQGKRYALVVPKDRYHNYYLEYRPSIGGLLTDSAIMLVGNETAEARLVDTTPYTPVPPPPVNSTQDPIKYDSGIAVGRTWSDLEADMHITVLSRNETVPPSLDVVYNRGPFPGNQAPTLAAITPSATTIAVGGSITFNASAATDANGDTLAYHWDFDDGVSAPNSAVITRTFSSAAQITAMVTVSDMKGGTVRRHVVVNVGTHGKQTVTGNITLAGQPVENVRVMITGGKYAFTDRSGNYALAGVSTGSQTLTTWFNGYTLTPSFTNPLNVIAGTNMANWTATASSTFVTLTTIADANEGGANGIFRFTRTGSTAADLLVRVADPTISAAINTSAAFATDYTLSPNRTISTVDPTTQFVQEHWTFTIPAGQASLDVSVAAVNDTSAEGPETIRLQLVHNGSYLLNSASSPVMTLNDNDTTLPQVACVSNDPYASEFPADPGSFTFTRSGSTAAALNVSVAWTGTATNGIDFTALPAVVTIPVGQSSVTLNVAPLNDGEIEVAQTVIATLQASTSTYVIDSLRGNSTVHLTDDDLPVVTVSVPDASASESGPDSGLFLIQRSGSTSAPLKVYYGVSGTALHGRDYASLSGEVTIPAGASSAPVLVSPYDDGDTESSETVVVTLATVTNTYSPGPNFKGTVTIFDNENLPLINVRSGVIGTEGGANATVIFRATGSGNGNVTVNYTVSGTATSGTDFTALPGSISIPANGTNDVTLTIPIINDAVAEATERLIITLTPDAAYQIENGSSSEALIRDNDSGSQRVNASAAISASPAEAGPVSGSFYLARTDSAADLVVNYQLSGTASNGIDYVNLPGTVTIPAGQPGTLVNLVPINDTVAEGIETVTLTVLPGAGYSPEVLGLNTLEIIDNEVLPTSVGFQTAQTLTSESPGANGEFRDVEVRLSAASLAPVTVEVVGGAGSTAQGDNVDWAFADAANGNALLPTATLTFAPGVTSRMVRIRVKDDGMSEGIESIGLELQSPRGASLSPMAKSHQMFIFDDAVPAVLPLFTEERWNTRNVYNNNTWDTVPPDFTGYLAGLTSPMNVGDSFSRRLKGLITAPTTGSYTFWIAADDAAKLFVSSDATPANKGNPRASLTSWTWFQNWTSNPSQQSAPITLTAGQSYYIEVQHLENGGGDHVSVAWQGPDFNRTPLDITAPNTAPDNAPRFVRFAATATTRLESDGSEPLLMAVLDRPAGATAITVNYAASGTATAGSDYSLVPGTLTFNPGEQIKEVPLAIVSDAIGEAPEVIVVSLSNPSGAALTSPTSHAITLLDVELPVVGTLFTTASSTMSVGTALGTVVATPAAGRSISGWTIVAGNTGNAFAINGTGQLTLATPAALPNPGGIQLIVRATDNISSTGDGLVNVICNAPSNGVVEHRWSGSSAFSNNSWIGSPGYNGTLATFTTPQNVTDDYSRRLTGYLKPTVSGDYTFWIAGDDDCRLYLSSTDSPSIRTQIAAVSGYTNYQSWDSQPGQKSAVIPLVAGKIYWLEIHHLEGGGGDHVSVAWQRSGSSRVAIPATEIFPYVAGVNFDNPPQPPSIALTSPNAGAAYDTGDNITLTSNVAGGSLAVTAVEFYRGSTLIGSDASAPYSVTWTNALAGTHVLTARAVYGGGAVISQSATVSVTDLDPAGDRDGDGFTNGLEFALGTDPKSAGSQPAAIHANLRAWWKFDETSGIVADDATGRPQDGVVTGATWTAGITGNALSLNGVDNGVLMTSAPSITGSGDFTVSAWVKLAPGSSGGTIIQQREPGVGGNLGQYTLNVNSNGTVSFSVYGTSGDQFNLTTTGTIHDGAWHLVAGTRQGVTGTILVDGFSAASGSSSSTLMPLATHAVSVGYDHRDNNKRFNGLIDDVRIHERALSAAELKSARDSLVPNSAPVFTASSLTAIATEDSVFSGQLSATDVDYGDTHTFSKIDGPGWLSIAANGGLSGTPGNSDVGSRAFTVRVTDASGLSTDATLAVSVINVNDVPVAVNDGSSGSPFVTLAEDGTAAAISVLANDSDIDGDPLTVTAASSPNGSVVINSGTTLSFSPTANFNGASTISYTISDGQGGTASATVFVSVSPVNDAPQFNASTLNALQLAKGEAISGEAYTAAFIDAVRDADGDSLSFSKQSTAPGWLVVDPVTATLSGTPAITDEGPVTVTLRATDQSGTWTEATLDITVVVRRSLAVNFRHSLHGATAVAAGETTAALNAAAAISGPVVWNNQAIDDAGNGPLTNGRGTGTYSGVTVSSFSANPWARGSESLSSSDASQRAFRYYLDDGDGGGGYFNGDSIGASIHVSGLTQFLTTNRATNYTLTLLFNADIAGASPFHPATVRSGIPSTPSSTAISSLPFIGTINPTLLGDGRQPLPAVGTDTGGQRGWGRLIGLTANDITISLPVSGGGKRGSVSGFILTPMNGPLALTPQGNGYVQWRDARFGGSSGNPLIAGETADPNGDGVSNLLAYSMGIDPLSPPAPTATSAQRGRLELVPANGGFSIDYQRDTRATDAILVLEQSATLGASGAWLPAVVTETILSDVGGIRTIRATFTPAPGDMRRFFRLRSSR